MSERSELWYGIAKHEAQTVAQEWKKHAQYLGVPHYLIWLDGLQILHMSYGMVAAQLGSTPLNARERQMVMFKFIHQCSKAWRMIFEPKGREPGATIRNSRGRRCDRDS
ncbi:MAG: hypothetical protein GY696_11680 [Gammaproteobacteria bacterium]|nr:hypothetical protein [Gammaproteobacteria bacterium]